MKTSPTMAGSGRVIAAAAVCTGVGAALGFVPGFVATALVDDLEVSNGQVGLLVSLYFGCTGIGSMRAGTLTERFGARVVIMVDMAVVAASALFAAVVGTYWALLVAAVTAGFGYALVNTGTNVVIARAVPATRRTMAMSVKTAGVPFMAMVAAAVGPVLAARAGWQAVVFVAAGLGAGALAIAYVVFTEERPEIAPEHYTSAPLPARFWWFSIAAFLFIAGSQPLYSWTVAYFEQGLDASPALAGGISASASAIGIVSMLFSARRADRIGTDGRIRLLMILLGITAVAIGMVLLGEAAGIAVAAAGTIIGISAQLAAIGTMHAAVVDAAPNAVARATGVTMTGYYIGGFASPFAFGALADATDVFAWSWATTAALTTLAIPAWFLAGRVSARARS